MNLGKEGGFFWWLVCFFFFSSASKPVQVIGEKDQCLSQSYLLCSALREDYILLSQLYSDQQNKVQAQVSCRAEGPNVVEGRDWLYWKC